LWLGNGPALPLYYINTPAPRPLCLTRIAMSRPLLTAYFTHLGAHAHMCECVFVCVCECVCVCVCLCVSVCARARICTHATAHACMRKTACLVPCQRPCFPHANVLPHNPASTCPPSALSPPVMPAPPNPNTRKCITSPCQTKVSLGQQIFVLCNVLRADVLAAVVLVPDATRAVGGRERLWAVVGV
jgi:hypothetical protein